MRMVSRTMLLAVLGALLLVPCAAWAGLAGDTVHVTLTDLDTLTDIIDADGVVSILGPPVGSPEFSGSFVQTGRTTNWRLDMLDNGFVLAARCVNTANGGDCSYDDGLRLVISNLDFTPPADLTGLASSSGQLTVSGSPVVTPSSISIDFASFAISSGSSHVSGLEVEGPMFQGTFETTPRVAPGPGVPLPATLVLLAGGLGLSALAVARRKRS